MQHTPLNAGKKLSIHEISSAREVPIVNGTCMILQIEVFKKLGGFDESFFAYFEDWDLCFRTRDLGYRILHVPEAIISHHGSATTGKNTLIYQFLMTRNRYLIARKHLPLVDLSR
ncbi:MAG: glycosyltransferase [Proteobacteria bacterium]|nr:glycosyltransferase [Pseudomonadota bacterium]